VANGYATDTGANVFLGLAPEDLFADEQERFPCVSITEGEAVKVSTQGPVCVMQMPVQFLGATLADPRNPNAAGHKLLADLQKALWPEAEQAAGHDRLGGNARSFVYESDELFPRAAGKQITAVLISGTVDYPFHPGQPDK
jgi:hypothetical protein